MRYYPAVGPALPHSRAGRSRVPHPFAGDPRGPPDLHVLSTPPAFVLSQDQTLQECLSARSNAVHPLTRSPASGINSCHCPLPAAHERRGSSRATARPLISIVNQLSPTRIGWSGAAGEGQV